MLYHLPGEDRQEPPPFIIAEHFLEVSPTAQVEAMFIWAGPKYGCSERLCGKGNVIRNSSEEEIS
jgi:hypothetical protein